MTHTLFELELFGGTIEQRYRRLRPEVEQMPWHLFDPSTLTDAERQDAQRRWTEAAFQEYRTGLGCVRALDSMLEARAPLDMIALVARFPMDEMVHVELCSRMAMLHGGGQAIAYPEGELVHVGADDLPPLLQATHRVVSVFCLGEAFSIPMLHAVQQAAKDPLTEAVMARIVRDEADHGTFGWAFLDWVRPHLSDEEWTGLTSTAQAGLDILRSRIDGMREGSNDHPSGEDVLGWMPSADYAVKAEHSLGRTVIAPLAARGIDVHI